MARPRYIEMEQGNVRLKGFPKEIADKLVELLSSFNKVIEVETPKEEILKIESTNEISIDSLKDKAVGLKYNLMKKCYEVVIIKYNLDNNVAVIDQVKNAGEGLALGVSEFKTTISELKLW